MFTVPPQTVAILCRDLKWVRRIDARELFRKKLSGIQRIDNERGAQVAFTQATIRARLENVDRENERNSLGRGRIPSSRPM